MDKKLKRGPITFIIISLMMTVIFMLENNQTSKAFALFSKRVDIKKTTASSDNFHYDWTGLEVKPKVDIVYKGVELVEGVDYLLHFENNIDAGVATCDIEGIGRFKGKGSYEFYIDGIDISRYKYTYHNGDIVLYNFNGEVVDESNYKVVLCEDKLYKNGKDHNVYMIKGKGQYSGEIYVVGEATN